MNSDGNAPPSPDGQPPRVAAICPRCGSADVFQGVPLSLTAESGSVGLTYKANFLLRGTEPLLADLCRACGTVVRLHVAQPDRNWTGR
jgi:hypothetical protein